MDGVGRQELELCAVSFGGVSRRGRALPQHGLDPAPRPRGPAPSPQVRAHGRRVPGRAPRGSPIPFRAFPLRALLVDPRPAYEGRPPARAVSPRVRAVSTGVRAVSPHDCGLTSPVVRGRLARSRGSSQGDGYPDASNPTHSQRAQRATRGGDQGALSPVSNATAALRADANTPSRHERTRRATCGGESESAASSCTCSY